MSTTPTTAASPEDRARYSRQIEQAFEGASKIAGSNLPPAEFYEKFLNTTLQAIDAPAGAVWLRTPQGFLQLACQENIDKVGLDNRRGGRQCHNEVLRQVFQANPPRPVMLEPNGRMQPGPGEPGPVPPANLTDHFAPYPAVLVRLSNIRRGELRELLAASWRQAMERSSRRKTKRRTLSSLRRPATRNITH